MSDMHRGIAVGELFFWGNQEPNKQSWGRGWRADGAGRSWTPELELELLGLCGLLLAAACCLLDLLLLLAARSRPSLKSVSQSTAHK